MYDSEISPPESDTIIPESDLSADPADTEMLPEDAAAFTAAYPVDEETAQWRQQNLTAEADRESYISGTDPVRALREASKAAFEQMIEQSIANGTMDMTLEEIIKEAVTRYKAYNQDERV
ncbi:hypothetical protein [Parvularcula sp. IMCC14364]|uniref:hypothetical protein n=1 Tax=Parvularcula sp. IMCC14364 TaxID=3067902 RepID=UPI0027427F00|nr:hypothetical protein [Parvularcula sp. IMCC14364]